MITALVVLFVTLASIAVVLAAASIRVLREYERAVVFRLGRLLGQKGPGLVLLIPAVDRMVRVDLRTIVLDIPPQAVITRDNVPAKVNAVCYFRVVDATALDRRGRALPEGDVADRADHAALGARQGRARHAAGRAREAQRAIQQTIDEQTEPWGIKVTAVEISDVEIPSDDAARDGAARPRPSASGARRSSTPRASSRPPSSCATRPT